MLRRLLRILGWTVTGLVMVIVLTLGVLTVTGIPVPSTITADGLPKVSIWRVPAVARTFAGTPMPMDLLGFDAAGRLLLDRGADVVALAADGEVQPTSEGWRRLSYGDLDALPLPGRDRARLVRRMRSAAEETDLLLVDGEREDTLLRGDPAIRSMAVAPDGRVAVAYGMGAEGAPGSLYRLALDGGPQAPQPVTTLEGTVLVQAVSADGGTAWVLASPAERDGRMLAVDLATGGATPVLADEDTRLVFHGQVYDVPLPRFRLLDDSTALYVRTGPDPASPNAEFTGLWLVDLRAREGRQVSPADVPADVTDFAVTPDGRTVVYVMEERAAAGLYAWDRVTGENRVLYRSRTEPLSPFMVPAFRLHPTDGRVYAQTVAADGFRIRAITIATGESDELLAPPHAGRPAYTTREIDYPTAGTPIGGMTGIHAFVHRPVGRDDERLPVVVLFHGGPSDRDTPFGLDPLAQLFLGQGYAVIRPNYRGSIGYGTTFEQADDVLRRREQVEDVLALSDWIRRQPDLDGDRVVLAGVSWGGFMTLTGLIADSTRFRGGIVFAPATLRPDTIAQGGPLAAWNAAEFGDMRDSVVQAEISKVSPALNAGQIRQPVFAFQGVADVRVMAETVRQMRNAIRASGGTIWYVESATVGHGPPQSPHELIYVLAAALEFLDGVTSR